MKILLMEERHLPGVAAIERACFSHPWSENGLREELGRGIFLVAEGDDGAPVGYVGCQTVLDEGYITNVAVLPAFRRKGVAETLLHELAARAGGLSFVTLEVRQSNAAAIGLYTKMGYQPVGTRRNFYADPTEDALLMTWARGD